jgi:hypothetical protein
VPEESTIPDLVERGRGLLEAANRRDFDAALSFFAPDAVWETVALGTTFEGVAAIRGFWQDWWASYEELWIELEEPLELFSSLPSTPATRPRGPGRRGNVNYSLRNYGRNTSLVDCGEPKAGTPPPMV